MASSPNPYLIDEDCPEWTDEQLENPLRASDIFTPEQLEGLKQLRFKRGAQKAPVKKQVTLRLDEVVIEKFKSTGAGWQSRINQALNEYQIAK